MIGIEQADFQESRSIGTVNAVYQILDSVIPHSATKQECAFVGAAPASHMYTTTHIEAMLFHYHQQIELIPDRSNRSVASLGADHGHVEPTCGPGRVAACFRSSASPCVPVMPAARGRPVIAKIMPDRSGCRSCTLNRIATGLYADRLLLPSLCKWKGGALMVGMQSRIALGWAWCGVMFLGVAVRGAVVLDGVNVSSGNSQATADAYTPDIVGSDLIDVSQTSLDSWTKDKDPFFETTTLNDGVGLPETGAKAGTYMPASFGSSGKLPFTYTFTLDTTVRTNGYDVFEIRTFAGWDENGSALGNQKYELLVSMTGTAAFVSLGTFTYTPFSNAAATAASATKVTLTEGGGGVITTAVDAVRFVFLDPGFTNGNSSIDGTVYYEVDVLGAPVEVSEVPIAVSGYQYDGSGEGAQPSTSPAWPDSGGVELINGVLPSAAHYTDPEWVGFLDSDADDLTSHPQVTFELVDVVDLTDMQIVYFHSTGQAGGTVTAPEEVLVSFSTNGAGYSVPVSFTSEFNHGDGDQVRLALLDVSSNRASHVRLDFRNTSPWTFLAEVTFHGSNTTPVPIALDDGFAGTSLNITNWIEHDSDNRVTQSNGLFMVTGTASWTDCGLESIKSFSRQSELVIESIAKVSTSGNDATPIGYGNWDLGTACYFLTFRSNGHFFTWKEYSGVDTGITYTPDRWYLFRMRLTAAGITYNIYPDLNDDGDFDDAGEDADLLANAPGRYRADAAYDNLKVRFNNHSAGLMSVKRVTVRERVTHVALRAAIAAAQALHDGAVEGTASGAYPAGARATLQTAIDDAQAVDDDPEATREELEAAETNMAEAVNAFRRSVNGGLLALNHILGTGQSLSVGWSGGPPLTTTQPYGNLMLSGVGQTGTDLVPLIEGPNLHSAQVETISSALANTLTALSPQTNYTSIVTRHGEGGVAYAGLKKGTTWYAKGMDQVQKSQAAAAAMGHDYKVVAVTTVHGESDHAGGNGPHYVGYLKEWQSDYDTDVKALTGQTNDIPMFFCQMSSHTKYNSATSLVPAAQLWTAENSRWHTLVCPKYFLTYSDGVHLTAQSYRHLGEYYGKALKRVLVDGGDWHPLTPTVITLDGTNITVGFHVPAPPLMADTNAVLAQTNLGFEYADDASSAAISHVSIANADTIAISLDGIPTGANPRLRYAHTGTAGSWAGWNQAGAARGNIRDSDATASLYGSALQNWLVHFDHPIPYDPARDDADHDGVPDRWENLNFDGTNVSHGASSNADGDPMSDYAEWAAGTDPRDTTDFFRLYGKIAESGTAFELSWDTLHERDYTLFEVSTLSGTPPWSNLFTTSGNDSSITYTNTRADTTQRFFRVQLTVKENE